MTANRNKFRPAPWPPLPCGDGTAHFKVRRFRSGSKEALLDHGQGSWARGPTTSGLMGTERQPRHLQAALLRLGLDGFARRLFLSRRQKHHAQPERRRQFDSSRTRMLADQFFRDASQQAGAVTASSVRVHTSAMRQPDQRFEGAVHDLARSRPTDLGDQADTAGVVVCGLGDSDSSLHCVSSIDRGSTIENFDAANGFFGQRRLRTKGFNHQGHEGTRRKTLNLGTFSFVNLRVLRG